MWFKLNNSFLLWYMSVSRTVSEIFSVKYWCDLDFVIWGYRSLEVTETGTIRKHGYDILFAFNSNYGSLLQHFEDKARYWSKILYVYLFWYDPRTWQTDRWTDTAWRHIPWLCIASCGKNRHFSYPGLHFFLCTGDAPVAITQNVA